MNTEKLSHSLQRLTLATGLLLAGHQSADAATNIVTVNTDGSFTPVRVEIFSGDTVEWKFASRTDTIIPVNLGANGQPDCANYKLYDPTDPNEFTGPLPRAASGIFTLSPEEAPYTSQDATWRSTNFTGVFIRPRWDEVHLGPGQFRWTEVDAEIEKAVRNRKVFSLGFKAGTRGTPQWIFNTNRTDAPVAALDLGERESGRPAYYGSPADPNFRKHYFDMLRAFAAHLRSNNAHYRALAYIKISGLNLQTHENRLPNDSPDILKTWAETGNYRPANLYSFYREQTALLAGEFPGKDMSYALIQDGFPLINNLGEYAGQSAPTNAPLPVGAAQTEFVLAQGRNEHGLRYVVQHNGLQEKPAFCPGSGVHPTILDPNFHYVGSGCPNRWVLAESIAGQVTGYQDVAGFTNSVQLESSIQNQWDNSDGVFLEIYEGIGLQANAAGLPSGMTLAQWADRFHARRRANFPTIPDPFPLTYSHTFTSTSTSGGAQLLHFVNGSTCSAGAATSYGTVAILPDLSFTSITRTPNNSVQLTLNLARAGTVRIKSSENLTSWTLLQTQSTTGGTVVFTDTASASRTKFYRAILQ